MGNIFPPGGTAMKKRLLLTTLLLAALFALCMSAYAAEYDLWVGGVQVTDGNLVIDSADARAGETISGSATYDPATKTLTLDNYSYTGNSSGISIRTNTELTINLVGSSSLTVIGISYDGISLHDSAIVTFTGSGSLTINAEFGIYSYNELYDCKIINNASGTISILSDHPISDSITVTGSGSFNIVKYVYVGNVSLAFGMYLGTNGIVSDTKPSSGYAHLSADGNTLTLNNYSYDGAGYQYATNGYAAIYTNYALNIVLKGENSLKCTNTGGHAYGIHASSVTISGTGKLDITVTGSSCGIMGTDGVSISGGTLEITAYDGISINSGEVTISGGTVNIHATEYGVTTGLASVSITGGTVNITTTHRGLYTVNVNITGGNVDITATDSYAYGIYVTGNVTISGGMTTIDAGMQAFNKEPTLTGVTYLLGSSHLDKSVIIGGLWVGGVQVTSENLVIDRSDNSAITGIATYDPSTKTLTLNNFSYEGAGYAYGGGGVSAAVYSNLESLRIELVGENLLTNTESHGIVMFGDVTITGTGSLTIDAVNCISNGFGHVSITGGTVNLNPTRTDSYGIYANAVTISGKTTSVTIYDVAADGIHAIGGDVTITGSTVTFKDCDKGIYVAPDGGIVKITDANVTVDGHEHCGIQAVNVKITGSTVSFSCNTGISANNLTIKESTADFTTKDHGINIYSNGSAAISDSKVTIKAIGVNGGIQAANDSNVTISGDRTEVTIKVSGNNPGIQAENGTISISGGAVTIDAYYGLKADNGAIEITGGSGNIVGEKQALWIGAVDDEGNYTDTGKLTIGDRMKVLGSTDVSGTGAKPYVESERSSYKYISFVTVP
ncbi:MAG: carbohydrate-binding domain-containing protein, partial [Ruminococcaceae bacterium]|nr:carbohydrate-binding domain-containing protein [Oscillospiraceae bacterium]